MVPSSSPAATTRRKIIGVPNKNRGSSSRSSSITVVTRRLLHHRLRGGDHNKDRSEDLITNNEPGTFVSPHQRDHHHSNSNNTPLLPLPNTVQRSISFLGAPSIILIIIKTVIRSFLAIVNVIVREIQTLTFHQKLFFVATFLLGFGVGRVRHPFWKRFTDVNEIPIEKWFGAAAPSLRGHVVSVSDGDTIRFLHQPTWFHPSTLRKGEKLSSAALPIRLCTIDAPETAKFGKPGQPFGDEAKEYLKTMLGVGGGKNVVVRVRLLQKDQYGRAVAQVYTTSRFPLVSFFRRFLSLLSSSAAAAGTNHVDAEMLKEGLAEVYTGGGAVYGPLGKDEYLALQDKAQRAKKGIWSLKKRETASEYKKRIK